MAPVRVGWRGLVDTGFSLATEISMQRSDALNRRSERPPSRLWRASGGEPFAPLLPKVDPIAARWTLVMLKSTDGVPLALLHPATQNLEVQTRPCRRQFCAVHWAFGAWQQLESQFFEEEVGRIASRWQPAQAAPPRTALLLSKPRKHAPFDRTVKRTDSLLPN